MKKHIGKILLFFGCLGVIVAIAGVFIFTGLSAFEDVTEKEFSPLNAIPEKGEIDLVVGNDDGSNLMIEDLAYIKAIIIPYTDDADPEYDGLSINISFYNSKSELISFEEVPIVVKIELYAYKNFGDAIENQNSDLIYVGSVEVDHSVRMGEIAGKYIRIPFEDIGVDQEVYEAFGVLIMTIETPHQGEFADTFEHVWLYITE